MCQCSWSTAVKLNLSISIFVNYLSTTLSTKNTSVCIWLVKVLPHAARHLLVVHLLVCFAIFLSAPQRSHLVGLDNFKNALLFIQPFYYGRIVVVVVKQVAAKLPYMGTPFDLSTRIGLISIDQKTIIFFFRKI